MTDTTDEGSFSNDNKDLLRRLADLEQRVAAQAGTNGTDTASQMAGFGNSAKLRLEAISKSGGFPIWVVVLVCALALYGAFELLEDLPIF